MLSRPHDPRRWFRFSLRTFFVLLTLLGVWLGVQVKWLKDRAAARAWVQANGGAVLEGHGQVVINEGSGLTKTIALSPAAPLAVPWSIRILGASGVAMIYVRETYEVNEDDTTADLKRLFPEAQVVALPSSTEVHQE